jgi:hypothetical protein
LEKPCQRAPKFAQLEKKRPVGPYEKLFELHRQMGLLGIKLNGPFALDPTVQFIIDRSDVISCSIPSTRSFLTPQRLISFLLLNPPAPRHSLQKTLTPLGLILYPSLPLSPRTLACQLVAHEVPDSHGAGAERHSGRVVGGGAAALRGEEVGAVRRELGRAAG